MILERKHYHISVNCLSALFIPYLFAVCRDMLDSIAVDMLDSIAVDTLDSIAVNMTQEPESWLVSIQLHGSMSEYQFVIVVTEDIMTTDFNCISIIYLSAC